MFSRFTSAVMALVLAVFLTGCGSTMCRGETVYDTEAGNLWRYGASTSIGEHVIDGGVVVRHKLYEASDDAYELGYSGFIPGVAIRCCAVTWGWVDLLGITPVVALLEAPYVIVNGVDSREGCGNSY